MHSKYDNPRVCRPEFSARPKVVSKFAAVDIKTVFAPSSITSTKVFASDGSLDQAYAHTTAVIVLRVMTEKRLHVAFCHPDLGLGGDH